MLACLASQEAHVVAVRPGIVEVAAVEDARVGDGASFQRSRLRGRVIAVQGRTVTVRLPVNVTARLHDAVCLDHSAGGGVDLIPPRPVGVSMAGEVQIGPGFSGSGGFILGGLGSDGLQTVSSAELVYRAPQPFALRITLAHAALSFASPSNIAAVDVSAGASYDHRYFELGLSVGVASYNESYLGATTAFVIDPLVRFGAVDGLSLTITGQLSVLNDGNTRSGNTSFDATGIFGVVSIPVGEGFWLLKRIGLSLDGYAHFDGAVRFLVRGNGARGSVFMLASAGVVATYFTATQQILAGPMFGLGFELRR